MLAPIRVGYAARRVLRGLPDRLFARLTHPTKSASANPLCSHPQKSPSGEGLWWSRTRLFVSHRGDQFIQGIRLALEGAGEYLAVLGHVDTDFLALLLAERRDGLVQDGGQQLRQFQHLVMTIGFGLIHKQTLQIAAAAVHHFDGHSSPHMPSRYWV